MDILNIVHTSVSGLAIGTEPVLERAMNATPDTRDGSIYILLLISKI